MSNASGQPVTIRKKAYNKDGGLTGKKKPHLGGAPWLGVPALEGLLLDLSTHLSKAGDYSCDLCATPGAYFYRHIVMPVDLSIFYGTQQSWVLVTDCSLHYHPAIYKNGLPTSGLSHCRQVSVPCIQFNPNWNTGSFSRMAAGKKIKVLTLCIQSIFNKHVFKVLLCSRSFVIY